MKAMLSFPKGQIITSSDIPYVEIYINYFKCHVMMAIQPRIQLVIYKITVIVS